MRNNLYITGRRLFTFITSAKSWCCVSLIRHPSLIDKQRVTGLRSLLGRSRTDDIHLRRVTFYPAELRGDVIVGRSLTQVPYLPRTVRHRNLCSQCGSWLLGWELNPLSGEELLATTVSLVGVEPTTSRVRTEYSEPIELQTRVLDAIFLLRVFGHPTQPFALMDGTEGFEPP